MPKYNEGTSAFSVYKKVQFKKIVHNKKKQKPVGLRRTKLIKKKEQIKLTEHLKSAKPSVKSYPYKSHENPVQSVIPEKRKKLVKPSKKNYVKKSEDTPDAPLTPEKRKKSSKQVKKDSSNNSNKEVEQKSQPTISDDPNTEALQLLEWMLCPLAHTDFFQRYWELKPIHIKRNNPTYYTNILNSTTLDKILRNNQLHYSRNVDVVSYENGVKEVFNLEGRATASALWDYYSNGCSIRVLNPQTYDKRVHLLLATLQEHFGTMVGANVYLTPPGSQGFAPHYDDIEAFVVQLEGCKYWKLYKPKDEDVLARYSSGNFQHADLDAPFMEVTLRAGDLLYFPRGVIHEARTDADSHSLHITVSVYQQTAYVDLLEHIIPAALKKAASNDVEFRKGLPLDYLKKCGVAASRKDTSLIERKVKELLFSLSQYVDVHQAADQMGKKFMIDSIPPVLSKDEANRTSQADGNYLEGGRVCNRVEITPDTRIRLIRYYCVRVVQCDGASPKLYYNTENARVYHGEEEQWLELDSTMVPAIRKLQTTFPKYVKVEELPMEDTSIKMQLVADLWEHGLLITERPLQIV